MLNVVLVNQCFNFQDISLYDSISFFVLVIFSSNIFTFVFSYNDNVHILNLVLTGYSEQFVQAELQNILSVLCVKYRKSKTQ